MAIVNDDVKKKSIVKDGILMWKYLDKFSFFAILGLLGFSIVFVYSSSVYVSINETFESPYATVMKQFIFAVIGLIVYFISLRVPTKVYYKLLLPIVIIVLLLMCGPFLFDARNGAHRWIELGVFTFQPAELAKLTIILIWAHALSVRTEDFKIRLAFLKQKKAPIERYIKRVWLSWRQPIGMTLAFLFMFLLQSDNGSLVISVGIVFLLIFASGHLPKASNKIFFGIVVVLVAAIVGLYLFIGSLGTEALANAGDKTGEYNYFIGRFVAWVNPFAAYSGAGYQIANSLIAIANGGLFGRGIGNGLQKQGFLTEGHNDFIIANIVEEVGIVGVSIIYIMYLTIITKGYQIARQSREQFNTLLATGIVTLFFFQAFWNSGGIIGLLPMKGLTAPLLSYGGTSLIIMLFCLGVLQRINIQNRKKTEKLKKDTIK